MTNAASPAIPDLRPVLGQALDQTGVLIAGLEPQQANLPTPCSEYDVAGLVGHLQGVVRRITTVLSGRHFSEAPSEVPSDDWAGDWAAGRATLEPVLADNAVLSREVTVPWGTVPGGSAIGMYVGELTVHAWDLATATGQTDALDPALAEGALPPYQQALPPQPRGGEIPFDPVVEVGADAGPYERLVAWTGRNPTWR
jgi:uncharacterized protein (TIGR03086 family)